MPNGSPGLNEITTTTQRSRNMPIKGQSPKQVMHTEMHKFKHGTLHSGSKKGPEVTNRKQAIAIAMSEAGKARRKVNHT